jgi:hypothetical protein
VSPAPIYPCLELLLRGYTTGEVTRLTGCSHKTAYFAAQRAGLPLMPKGNGSSPASYLHWRLEVRVWASAPHKREVSEEGNG